MTYYELLGVAKDSNPDEIKRAYRKLASQHHPDKGGDKTKFQEIQAAYDTLGDASKRQQYDMQQNGFGGDGVQFHWHGNGVPPDIHDLFKTFGFGHDPFARQQARRNKDLRIDIGVTLLETLEEQNKSISVQTTNNLRENIEVKIPRGITTGTNIKYPGLGDNFFNTLPRGDLYVQVHVVPSENFSVAGIDLYSNFSVNCLLAITGGVVSVKSIDDREFLLTIPAGTQPGTKFRIANQGLYQLNSSIRGNLYLEMAVSIPQNLSPDSIESIRSISNKQ